MKKTSLILLITILVTATCVFAAEKSKILAQLDASRAAVDALALKVGENREAAAALEQARSYLQKAADVQAKSRQLFGVSIGFGDLKPEAEEEINNYLEISNIAVVTSTSRLEKARAVSELEVIDKQLENVKAKIKVFEDRKAELEKLKAEAAKCQTASKELEAIKAEKIQLTTQIEQLVAERGKADKQKSEQADLAPKIETMKAENSRLSGQIEKQLAEIKTLTSQLEEAKKTAVISAVPEIKPSPVTLKVPAKEPPVDK